MLRNTSTTPNNFGNAVLSVEGNHSVSVLLSFIDANISGFRDYYFKSEMSSDENFISHNLVNYFNSWLNDESNGFAPYKFSFGKNPPQHGSRKETDIGVVILNPSQPSQTIIEFEAKRLSDSSANSEYVYGERGGIERFKRNYHGAHLTICGMFGYIQSKTTSVWVDKINGWITKLSNDDTDNTIDWNPPKEKLKILITFEHVDKYESENVRINKPILKLYHYFINLVPN